MVIKLPVMGAAGSFIGDDRDITMEDIFGEIQLVGQQTNTAPPTVARAAVAEEFPSDRAQEEGLPVEHPSTPMAGGSTRS